MLSRSKLFAATLAEASSARSTRFADLMVSVCLADVEVVDGKPRWKSGSDEELIRVGGRWDRKTKVWRGDAAKLRILRVHRGQEEPARWFCEWLRRFIVGDWEGFNRAHAVLWLGARRSGKTTMATMAACLLAVAQPKSIIWMCSPTLDRSDELDVALREMLPKSWYTRREVSTGKAMQFGLVNGSRILLRSGARPEALRSGRCSLAIYNEAQSQSERGFVNLRGAVIDQGSLVIACANPPESLQGMYLERLWEGVKEGTIDGVAHHFDSRLNPWIDQESLRAMESEVDSRTAARDIYGIMGVPIGDTVFHAWTGENVREPSADLIDITAAVSRREFGRAAGTICGVDLQRTPACVAAMFKIYSSPSMPGEEFAFVVDEFEGTDEDDLLNAIESTPRWQIGGRVEGETYRGWTQPTDNANGPVHTAAILDSSSWWQTSEHQTGASSDRRFAARRWRSIYKTQRDSDRNPDLISRFKIANARICSATGVRRLFVAPWCKATIEAMRQYPIRHGKADRTHRLAHRADATSYVAFRLWGATQIIRSKQEYRGLPRARAGEMKSW